MSTTKNMDFTVAITGMNSQPDNPAPGLAVARCLKDSSEFSGRIIGLGYDALDAGIYCDQYCDSGYLLPYPSSDSFEHINRLRSIHAKDPIDILIPCLDSELPGMIMMQPELTEMGIKTFLPTSEQLARRKKDRLSEIVGDGKMFYPESVNISNGQFFFDCEERSWRYPFVIKGVFYDAKVVHNKDEGIAAYKSIASQWGYPVMAQKFVDGHEFNVVALGDGKGNATGMVMMKKMTMTDKGKVNAGVSIHDPDLQQACVDVIKTLQWKGPLEIEVRRDNKGRYHLIEINPRFPAWVYLTDAVGQNLPIALLKLISGNSVPEPSTTTTGVMIIRHGMESIVPLSAFESVVVEGRTA